MRKIILLTTLILLLSSCRNDQQPTTAVITATPLAQENLAWSIYDPAPDHPWNRVFRQLYRRMASSREEYGMDELDPLLWFDTTYLLSGPSHQETIQVLDEFLSTHAENLIHDALKRAMFQHDLWAVFDWAASQSIPTPLERQALEARLVRIMQRVALSRDEILSLPDNYAAAVATRTFPASVDVDRPETAFLPDDIFQSGSAWVPVGREGGPVAMTHTEAFPFFGRSVFLVFLRSPDGREKTLDFIGSLNTAPDPVTTIGSDVALVRRMLLVDDQGELVLSPLVETIQIRHFAPEQHFHEFELDRKQLLQGNANSLELNEELFPMFMSHGDVFEGSHGPELQGTIPELCKGCHFEYPPIYDSGNTRSIISYSRQNFSLLEAGVPHLFPTTWNEEAQTVIAWKHQHQTWISMKALWERVNR